MLNDKSMSTFQLIKEEGPLIFISGIEPRTVWISAGGAIFLGMYETVRYILLKD